MGNAPSLVRPARAWSGWVLVAGYGMTRFTADHWSFPESAYVCLQLSGGGYCGAIGQFNAS